MRSYLHFWTLNLGSRTWLWLTFWTEDWNAPKGIFPDLKFFFIKVSLIKKCCALKSWKKDCAKWIKFILPSKKKLVKKGANIFSFQDNLLKFYMEIGILIKVWNKLLKTIKIWNFILSGILNFLFLNFQIHCGVSVYFPNSLYFYLKMLLLGLNFYRFIGWRIRWLRNNWNDKYVM